MGFIMENFGYKLTLLNGKELLIEGHKGVLEYLENSLTVRIRGGKLSVQGESVIIDEINEEELLVKGKIDKIEVLK